MKRKQVKKLQLQSNILKKKKIKFLTHDLGVPLDNLTRDDIYNLDDRIMRTFLVK